jgi:hypothetical protein
MSSCIHGQPLIVGICSNLCRMSACQSTRIATFAVSSPTSCPAFPMTLYKFAEPLLWHAATPIASNRYS